MNSEPIYEYLYSKEQASKLREKIIDKSIKPIVKQAFKKYPQLQSAALLVAQFWDDEAMDAVHHDLIFSVLETPDLMAAYRADEDNYDEDNYDEYIYRDSVNLSGINLSHSSIRSQAYHDIINLKSTEYEYWSDNDSAIPAFAAFCAEGCHQDMSTAEAYTLYAILRRQDDTLSVEIVGQMLRPWLDGIKPERWD